jgi:Domain of unknown function (DUF4157)
VPKSIEEDCDMYAQVEKSKDNKSRSVSVAGSQIQSGGESTFQFANYRPEAVVQRKLQVMVNNSPQVKQAAQLQAMVDNGLTDDLKAGVENLSGYSMDDVKVYYNSDKPAQLQAHAYAQGTDIHLGTGQEKHLPHEAWHVVQQKQGRLKLTTQLKGKANVNDDPALEKKADVMGGKAMQMKSSVNSNNLHSSSGHNDIVTQRVMNKLTMATWTTKVNADIKGTAYTGVVKDRKLVLEAIAKSRDDLVALNVSLDTAIDAYNGDIKSSTLLEVLKKAEDLDTAIYTEQDGYAGSVSESPYYSVFMGLLNNLAKSVETVVANVNSEADKLTKINRIGAGNAPELNKDNALKKMVDERSANSPKKGDLTAAISDSSSASKTELREGLSIDSALTAGTFKSLKKHINTGVDVDLETADPIDNYKYWDQKAMYLDGPNWDGRTQHTHDKIVEPDGYGNGQKTGLLVDTTYATNKDYERGWLHLNKNILGGTMDPKAIKETKMANIANQERAVLFDSTQAYNGGPGELSNLKLLHKDIKDAGFISQQIAGDYNGLKDQYQNKITCRSFVAYRDHRGRLPAGNYVEINGITFNGGQTGATVRGVINVDDGACYLTVTHYEPFTWKDGSAAKHQKSPFFELSALKGQITFPTE